MNKHSTGLNRFLRRLCACAALLALPLVAAADNWIGDSAIYVDGTWFFCGNSDINGWTPDGGAFDGAYLGAVSSVSFGGQTQVYGGGSGDTVKMGYEIDGAGTTFVSLAFNSDVGNNRKFQTGGTGWAPVEIDLSGCEPGRHTLAVWFVDESLGVWDSNSSSNYVATFKVVDGGGSLEPEKNSFDIVSPVPTGSTVEMIVQPPRLDTLQGKTIAMVGGSFSASVTHAVMRDMLVRDFGCKIYFMEEIGKGGSYNPINPSAQTLEFQRKLVEYGVDAVISGNCGCGICTVKETGNGLAAEVIGIPAVVVGAESFIAQVKSTGYNRGVPVVRTAAYPGAFASDDTATQQRKAREILYDQVVRGLTTPISQEEIDEIAAAVGSQKYDDRIFTGSYQRVQEFYKVNEMADGLPVVPPTDAKVQLYLRFAGLAEQDLVCQRNGEVLPVPPANRAVMAYQVAVNAIMAGCPPEYMPLCVAIVRCMANGDFYKPLQSTHAWTPYVLVGGPVARQLGIADGAGMINEKANKRLGRFVSLAFLNLAGYKIKENRMGTFGYMLPFAFAENERACLAMGWEPYHVGKGFARADSVVTCGSTMTWGNPVAIGTDDPAEALQLLAWEITEKQQNALGNTNPRVPRMMLVSEPAAAILAAGHPGKGDLERALVAAASRPLWMRTYAHYWANTGSKIHLNRTFDEYYEALKNGEETENVEADIVTQEAPPPWLAPIVPFAQIDRVQTMDEGHTAIVVAGGGAAATAQVMPGGDCASYKVTFPPDWDALVAERGYTPLANHVLAGN